MSCSGVETHEMILIDALVHSAGDAVSQLWKDEDGSGMYPPPSLHVSFFFFVVALDAHCGHLLYAVYRTPWALRLTVSEQCSDSSWAPCTVTIPTAIFLGTFHWTAPPHQSQSLFTW